MFEKTSPIKQLWKILLLGGLYVSLAEGEETSIKDSPSDSIILSSKEKMSGLRLVVKQRKQDGKLRIDLQNEAGSCLGDSQEIGSQRHIDEPVSHVEWINNRFFVTYAPGRANSFYHVYELALSTDGPYIQSYLSGIIRGQIKCEFDTKTLKIFFENGKLVATFVLDEEYPIAQQ